MLAHNQDPANALSWFRWYRRAAGGLVLVSASSGALWGVGPRWGLSTALLGAFVLVELGETVWLRRRPASWRLVDVAAGSALAAVALACVLFRAGDHPALTLLLQLVIPCALVLPTPRAWVACTAVILLHNGMVYV